MRPIPKKLLNEMLADPYYKVCARRSGECDGRITFEHAFTYSGKQINEKWAIIPLCWYHHLGLGMQKRTNQQIAIARASANDLKKYPRMNWNQFRNSKSL